MPSIKVGGVPLAPIPPPQTIPIPSWKGDSVATGITSIEEQRQTAQLALARHTTALNPYAHPYSNRTVFPPQPQDVGVTSGIIPSPFPGAYPLIPPPSGNYSGASGGDRDMRELLGVIRAQLSHPATTAPSASTTRAAPTVAVSAAEREVLRSIRQDFVATRLQSELSATAYTPPGLSIGGAPMVKGNKEERSQLGDRHGGVPYHTAAQKTVFNYHAKPFIPGGGAGTEEPPNMTATPPVVVGRTPMNANAPAFVPRKLSAPESTTRKPEITVEQSIQTQGASTGVFTTPAVVPTHSLSASSKAPVVSLKSSSSAASLGTAPRADPWASYESFVKWRNMMEEYYKSAFAAHDGSHLAAKGEDAGRETAKTIPPGSEV